MTLRHQFAVLLIVTLTLLPAQVCLAADSASELAAEEKTPQENPPAYSVHHWGVWLADPALPAVNDREHFTTGLPLAQETTRPRQLKGGKKTTPPINVVTFRGQPAPTLEVDVRAKSGTFVGHWPASQVKSNRLRWIDGLLAAKQPENASWATAPPEHWILRAREDEDVLTFCKGARSEKFLAYDFDAPLPLPLKLSGGPDIFELRSTSDYPLHDILIVSPAAEGRRIGWLDVLPAAHEKKPSGAKSPAATKPAENAVAETTQLPAAQAAPVAAAVVPQGAPVKATAAAKPAATPDAELAPGPPVSLSMAGPLAVESDGWAAESRAKLRARLLAAGLHEHEIDLLLASYEPAIFNADELTVVWRLPGGAIDEVNPLACEPEPSKTVRVVLVIARHLDPKITTELQQFVDQLGSRDYKQREAAERRLTEYGSIAFPALKKALTSSDPEIVFRAERMLLEQKQSIDAPSK